MAEKPTHLTKDGLRFIIEDEVSDISGIYQILDFAEKKSINLLSMFEVTLSDGFSKMTVYFNEQITEFTNGKLKNFDIIKLEAGSVKTFKESKRLYVSKFSIIYTNQTKSIGDPFNYSDYKQNSFVNHKGSNKIPLANIGSGHGMSENLHQNPQSARRPNLPLNSEPNANFLSLKNITPLSDNWRVKAKIIKKYEKKTWSNERGQGELFSIDIADWEGNEMGCTFFKQNCEKWVEVLEEGKTYVFSGGHIKVNNRRYSNNSDYNIVFDEKTEIEEASEDNSGFKQKFNFVNINKLNDLPVGTQIDVMGIVKDPGMHQEVNVKNSNVPKPRKNIQIFDETLSGIEITLWGDLALKPFTKNQTIAFKGLKINEFNSIRNLSSSYSTSLLQSLPSEHSEKLLKFMSTVDLKGENLNFDIQISQRTEKKLLRIHKLSQVEIEGEKIGASGEKVFIDVKGYLITVKNDERALLYYLGCPKENCAKKMIEDGDGWRCDACGTITKDASARYILNAKIADETSVIWINVFGKEGEIIIGKSANEIRNLKEQGQTDMISELFKSLTYKLLKMRLQIKAENYNGENKVKYQVVRIYPKDYNYDNKTLIDEIDEYLTIQ